MNSTISLPAWLRTLPEHALVARIPAGLAAVLCFHLSYLHPALAPFAVVSLVQLIHLAQHSTPVMSFYFGLAIGFAIFAYQFSFLSTIFGAFAGLLWLIIALYHAFFCWGTSHAFRHLSPNWRLLAIPALWTGLEYFRSELYLLRFSWGIPGYAFAGTLGNDLAHSLGVYGIGFLIAFLAVLSTCVTGRQRLLIITLSLLLLTALQQVELPRKMQQPRTVPVAGMQLEFPVALEVPQHLDRLKAAYPRAELFVLSEYTFDSGIPRPVTEWCRLNQKYLIVGGKEELGFGNFYNTAFVIGPTGEIVFKQVKSVPIQFFADGLPAPKREVWDSPWGRIGLAICYDLSYARVMDEFIQQGAEALIVPTMDVIDWGEYQHDLHARVALIRSAEYGIPIFKVASSGISQAVGFDGKIHASTSFPGQEEKIISAITFGGQGRLPADRYFAPLCSLATAGLFAGFLRKDHQAAKPA